MEDKQITLNQIYSELQNLKNLLVIKGILNNTTISENNEIIWDWPQQIQILADENLLAEDWLSPEDEETWKNL